MHLKADVNINLQHPQQQQQQQGSTYPGGPSLKKQKAEQEVRSLLRSLHSLLCNGLIYHIFWCFARGKTGEHCFGVQRQGEIIGAKEGGGGASSLLIIRLFLSNRCAAGPD